MKAHLITSIIFQLFCQIFGETIQRGNNENVKPVTSELNKVNSKTAIACVHSCSDLVASYMIPKKFSKYRDGGRGRGEGVQYEPIPSDFVGIEKKVSTKRSFLPPYF